MWRFTGITSAATGAPLNLIAHEADAARQASAALAKEKPWKNLKELKRLQNMELPPRHQVLLEDINPDRIASTLTSAYEAHPQDFEQLLATPNVGPKTMRALALLPEVIHGVQVSFRDPARFSFAHGGKDGHPYTVDRLTYDQSIHILKEVVEHARIGERDLLDAMRRLNQLDQP